MYRILMKTSSENFRVSAIQGIMKLIKAKDIKVLIYKPTFDVEDIFNSKVIKDIEKYKKGIRCDCSQ